MRTTVRIIGLFAICVTVFAACAQTRNVRTEIYGDRRTGVSLHKRVGPDKVAIPQGFSHPAQFDPDDFKYLMRYLRFQEKGLFRWTEARQVFSANELYRMTPHVMEAFDKATPDEEIAFRLTSAKSGVLFATERFTDGRMFVKDGKLNIVFANVNVRPDLTGIYEENPRDNYAGVLWRLIESDWQKLVKGEKGIHFNWVSLDIEEGLAEKRKIERIHRQRTERIRKKQRMDELERKGWEDWEPDEAVGNKLDQDVYWEK